MAPESGALRSRLRHLLASRLPQALPIPILNFTPLPSLLQGMGKELCGRIQLEQSFNRGFCNSPSWKGSAKMKCFSGMGEKRKEHVHDFERNGQGGGRNSREVCALADGIFACRWRAHGAV